MADASFHDLKNKLVDVMKELDTFWTDAFNAGLLGNPEGPDCDETSYDYKRAIDRIRSTIDGHLSVQHEGKPLTWFQQWLQIEPPESIETQQERKEMKKTYASARKVLGAMERSTKHRAGLGPLGPVAFNKETLVATVNSSPTSEATSSAVPLSRPFAKEFTSSEKVPVLEPYLIQSTESSSEMNESCSPDQKYQSSNLLKADANGLLEWWNSGNVKRKDVRANERLPDNIYDLESNLKKLAQKLILVVDQTRKYKKHAQHVREARQLCYDVRDLIILFTRRFVDNRGDEDAIRTYVELTINILYEISRFLIYMQSPILNARTDLDLDSLFKKQTESFKEMIHEIKSACVDSEARNFTEVSPDKSPSELEHGSRADFAEEVYGPLDFSTQDGDPSIESPEQTEHLHAVAQVELEKFAIVREREMDAQATITIDYLIDAFRTLKIQPVEVYEGTLNHPIGQGSYGVVSRTKKVGQPWVDLAVKLPIKKMGNEKALRTMLEEARVWSRVRMHENILRLRGYTKLTCSDYPGLVSDYHEGGNLSNYLARTSASIGFSERLGLAKDVLRALQKLHHLNISHGDVRAVNILVNKNGRAIIHDFGIASIRTEMKIDDDKTTNSKWLAPEIRDHDPLQGPLRLTISTDMYAYGTLLYEILAGAVPDIQTSVEETHRLKRPAPPAAGIPKGPWLLIFDCWNPTPDARPEAWRCIRQLRLLTELYAQASYP